MKIPGAMSPDEPVHACQRSRIWEGPEECGDKQIKNTKPPELRAATGTALGRASIAILSWLQLIASLSSSTMSPGTAHQPPGTSAHQLYLHSHICATAAACQPGGEPALPSGNIHSRHPPGLPPRTTRCLAAEAKGFSRAEWMGEPSDRAVPGCTPSWCKGRGCAAALAWARVKERCGQGERGFGSGVLLIIKTCETFVSSLALPLWMAARRLAQERRHVTVVLQWHQLLQTQRCWAPESGTLIHFWCFWCSSLEMSLPSSV